jgi:hypothetical protein
VRPAAIRLTPSEIEAVSDRLALRDCIGDAMTDRHPSEPPSPFTRAEAEAAAERLYSQAIAGRVTLSAPIDVEVFADAVAGATIPGHYEDEPRKARSVMRALERVAEKIEAATGRKVRLPE